MANIFIQKVFERRRFFAMNLVAFFISKSAVFLAPLLLSNYLQIGLYGSLEYGINVGNIVAMVLGMGIGSSYPFFILKKGEKGKLSSFLLYPFIICLLLVLLAILSLFLGHTNYLWSILLALVFSVQAFFSSIYKTHERTVIAVLLDSGFYLFLLFFLVFAKYLHLVSFDNLFEALLLYALILLISFIFVFRKQVSFSGSVFNDFKQIAVYGLPLVVTAFLVMLLSSSGRILIEKFCSQDELAYYSFYFRLAAAIVVVHQFASIIFFKKLFTTEAARLDKYFCVFFSFLLAVNIFLFITVPTVFGSWFRLLDAYAIYREHYFLLAVFTVFWIAFALNEPLINRENLASRMNWWMLALIVTAGLMIFVVSCFRSIDSLVIIKAHFITLFVASSLQFRLLAAKGLSLRKTWITLSLIFSGAAIADLAFF